MKNVVLFGASWCAPCKATKPHVERVCDELGIPLEFVDVEFSDSRANDITAIPTVRVYDEYEEVIAEHRGGMSEVQVREFLAHATGEV